MTVRKSRRWDEHSEGRHDWYYTVRSDDTEADYSQPTRSGSDGVMVE